MLSGEEAGSDAGAVVEDFLAGVLGACEGRFEPSGTFVGAGWFCFTSGTFA
jgi:hypothetical protein